jgi:hypothetical protein
MWDLQKMEKGDLVRFSSDKNFELTWTGRDRSEAFDFPAIKPYTLLPKKDDRDRRLNVIHCRRKRYLKRVQVDILEDECAELRETRKGLLGENSRL